MPADLVVDASVLAAVFLREPGAEALAGRLRELLRVRTTPHARFEVANALWKRRGALTADTLVERARTLFRLPLDEEFTEDDATAAMTCARERGLTFYDAAYVARAQRVGVPLWTLDRAQHEAARRAGVAVTTDGHLAPVR